jgi:hypothetical protein
MRSKLFYVIVFFIGCVCTWVSCMHGEDSKEPAMPDVVSYNFNIRPILSDKCFKCHGPDANARKASLRLDYSKYAYAPLPEMKGAFAIVPGHPEQSELVKRISSTDSSYMMPDPVAHLGSLTAYQIKLFEKWIKQGAKYETHWAFVKPKDYPLPTVNDKAWPKNEIDYFILAKQEELGLKHNPENDKERLLKRVSLDLTGLPPTEEMMNKFMADKDLKAYDKIVDELLSTPQYGEKMALHWLDIARYADSYGYQDDNIRTQWPWRDWVIHAFNKNMPYDKFVTWQLAGDLLPNANKEEILATAFLRNQKYTEEGGIIPEEYRVEYNIDKTKTFGRGIIGLTVECAQCHDHKYDPISQKDYYQLYAFFNTSKEAGFEGDVGTSKPAKKPILDISQDDMHNLLSFINDKDTGSLMVSVMGDRDTLRKTYILNRGVYDQPTTEVMASAPKAVLFYDTVKLPRNRLGLAEWTVNKNNPLTARVFVNQMWQEVFGRGLVKTSGDFGMQGELPSHPELLDWLAVDFMDHGWNIKRLMKQIVTSATYMQSANIVQDNYKKDPENVYLSHAPRLRVKAEIVKDIILESSGLLVKTIGGPSVKPYQPKGLWESATSGRGVLATYKQDKGESLYRRGMYTFIKLTVPPPNMAIFDASNRDLCEVKRSVTSTPLQALMMMNDPTVLEASRVLAQKLVEEKTTVDAKITTAFHRIICRVPDKKESEILKNYFTEQLQQFKQKKLDAAETIKVGEYPADAKADVNTTAALMKVISTIYNMEEAITKS